ncbi:MAG: BspA family leucine-rich repeat surface protein, partial [Bacilli bacterium]|nr:BspA family leucine-rich repeat surface protein [Bacilli bacterium]
MNNMFYNCTNLTTIPQLDTSNVTDMSYMFYRCSSLKTIPQLDTSKVTNMNNMFYNCTNLTTIPQLDTSNVTDMSYMLYNCSKLTSIGMYGFTRSIDISQTALEHDAIVAFLNQAGTAYNSSQKITLGSTKLALLSDEEKAIATNKGWTLA